MNDYKQTIDENYEDALFAKLMDEHAQIEGTRLLEENERLKNDPDFHLPKGLDERSISTIRRVFKAKKRKERHGKEALIFKRIAIVILICAAVFTGLWCTASAFRQAVYNVFMTITEEKMDLRLGDDVEEETCEFGNSEELEIPEGMILPTFVPESYSLTSFSRDEMQMLAYYENNTGDQILYKEFSDGFTFGIDTENADAIETVSINGYEGVFVSKQGLVSVNWGDTDRAVLLRIVSKTISKEEILKMARSVTE